MTNNLSNNMLYMELSCQKPGNKADKQQAMQ